jgi:hypothetical protein
MVIVVFFFFFYFLNQRTLSLHYTEPSADAMSWARDVTVTGGVIRRDDEHNDDAVRVIRLPSIATTVRNTMYLRIQ